MKLSVVILNYNVKHFLEVCIKSVQKALRNIPSEIIVVDNASEDGSLEMMNEQFPAITYLYQNENTGFTVGNNIGVAHAKGEFICILNPDTIVAEDTFERLLEKYASLDSPGILGTQLIDGTGVFLPESKRGTPTPWVAITKAFELYKWFPKCSWFNKYYAMHIDKDTDASVEILVGAFLFMKKSFYDALGGFDEECFMYSDDADLSYCSLLEGKKNYYIGTIKTIHFKGESTSRDKKYMYRFRDAMQFFYKKHFKPSPFFSILVNIGIFLFAFKKKNEGAKKIEKPAQYVCLTNHSQIVDRLSKVVNKEVVAVQSLDEMTKFLYAQKRKVRVECLFDAEVVGYKEYIDFIYSNQERATFKIRPVNASFFVGSNDKNAKGEILKF